MIIEKNQKKILFEEAARRGVIDSNFLSIPEVYQDLLGISDYGERKYGSPLAPLYKAVPDKIIDIKRMSSFITGLNMDLRTSDLALKELEDSLYFFNLEIWTRTQLLKNRALSVSKQASTERTKLAFGAIWADTETFSNTNKLDMLQTTAWIDTAEGIATLPSISTEMTVMPQSLKLGAVTTPEGGNFLGSSPEQAFDGSEATSWRCLFTREGEQRAEVDILFDTPKDLTGVTIDPLGFGALVTVDIDNGTGWKNYVRAIIYSKKTFPLEDKAVKRARIGFRSTGAALPKVVGLRNVVFLSGPTSRFASIYWKVVRPGFSFSEIRVEWKGITPEGASITPYFSTTASGPWTKVDTQDWIAIDSMLTNKRQIALDTAQAYSGLFRVGTGGSPALSNSEGYLEVGKNQVEVEVVRKDWTEMGEAPHQPDLPDYQAGQTFKTWSSIPKIDVRPDSRVLQISGGVLSSQNSVGRGRTIVFQRKSNLYPYTEMCFVPLAGDENQNCFQFNHTYKFRFWVHAVKEIFYSDALYWFLQGYRNPNARTYREVGKSYGAFSMFINGSLIVSDSAPYTVTSSATLETGAEAGQQFTLKLNEGWNVVEILIHVLDPSIFGEDSFEVGDPYLQLNFTPCFFDPNFQLEYGITSILGTGQRRPISEFDLLWNKPQDPSIWAWDDSRQFILFNFKETRLVDGYFRGELPDSYVYYKSIGQSSMDLFLRTDLEREDSSRAAPIIDEQKVLVR